ncbi:MAG: response regulator [Anaerolineae bacterium]
MTEKPFILIVEDDFDLASMLEAYFGVQGYDTHSAPGGEDALAWLEQTLPDLIVLDIRLPDIDGFEVCRRLRTNRRTQAIPIIFLTEKSDRVDKLQGLELGVVDYITKPFDIQELRLRVRNALQRATQQTMTNPVTDLPEGPLTEEQLSRLTRDPHRAVLAISLSGLDAFRERYGFVASDDVLRAIALMIRGAVHDSGTGQDYLGHLDAPHHFVIVTGANRVAAIRAQIVTRIRQSMAYFYPVQDREALTDTSEGLLGLEIGTVTAKDGPFADVLALKAAIEEARQPVR